MNSTTLRLSSLESPPGGTLPPDRQRAVRDFLESIVRDALESEQPSRQPRWNGPRLQLRRTGLATAAAVGLVALSLVMVSVLRPDGEVVHAATPKLTGHETADGVPAADLLRDLAQRATAGPDTGSDSTIRTESWSLAVTVEGTAGEGPAEGAANEGPAEGAANEGPADQVTSAVIPVLRELTRNPDGSISVREVGGEPRFPNDEYERAWNENGQPGPNGQVLMDETLSASAWSTVYPADLPADPGRLKELIAAERPAVNGDAGELLRAIHELRLEQTLEPGVRSALIELLAGEDGVVSLGTTTDRSDRKALAIAADTDASGWPTRQILLLDPDDGRLLAYEQVLTEDVAQFDAAAPAIIDYTVFR